MDPVAINGALGAVLPLVLAVFEQGHWSPRLRAVFAILVALAAGVVAAHAEGTLAVPHGPEAAITLAGDIIAVLVASQAAYQALNKTGVTDLIEKRTDLPRIHVQIGNPAPVVVPPVGADAAAVTVPTVRVALDGQAVAATEAPATAEQPAA